MHLARQDGVACPAIDADGVLPDVFLDHRAQQQDERFFSFSISRLQVHGHGRFSGSAEAAGDVVFGLLLVAAW